MHAKLPKRIKWAHKGDYGYVLVIGGSSVYTGSPILAGLAALRSGADLVSLLGPPKAMQAAAEYSPDLITYQLPGELSQKDVNKIIGLAQLYDAILIGNGLAQTQEAHKAILKLIKFLDQPLVLDAEAIHAVAEKPELIKNKKIILTPHAKEFQILTKENLKDDLDDRKAKVKTWAKKLGVTILLKGHYDVISNGKTTTVNKTGSVFMTKAGTGDVLAGICASLLAQGLDTMDAACLAAKLNGEAGEKAAKKYGPGLLASDLLAEIAKML